MIGRWIADIRAKTKDMDRARTAEYIADYYWYHILFAVLGIFLIILLSYHLTWGRRTVSFACAIVNERADTARDAALATKFAEYSGVDENEVRIDSHYRVSYAGHEEEGAIESDYEKFFFGWSQGELDAVILPESLYRYVDRLGGRTVDIAGNGITAVPLNETAFAKEIADSSADPMVLIFPSTGKHHSESEQFLAFAESE